MIVADAPPVSFRHAQSEKLLDLGDHQARLDLRAALPELPRAPASIRNTRRPAEVKFARAANVFSLPRQKHQKSAASFSGGANRSGLHELSLMREAKPAASLNQSSAELGTPTVSCAEQSLGRLLQENLELRRRVDYLEKQNAYLLTSKRGSPGLSEQADILKDSLAVRLAKKLSPARSQLRASLASQPVPGRDSSEKFASAMDSLFVASFAANIKAAMRHFLADFLGSFRQAAGVTVHMRAQDESVDVLGPLMHEVKDGRLELCVGEPSAAEDSSRTLKLAGNLDGFKDVYVEQ